MDFALLPLPAGARKSGVDPRDTKFPARPEIKPGQGWIAASWNFQQNRAIVEGVLKNEAADRAGLQAGDAIVAVDGKKFVGSLAKMLELYRAEDKITLEIERDDTRKTLNLTVDPLPLDGGIGRLVGAAEAGEVWDMNALGTRYLRAAAAHDFVDKNETLAIQWLRRAVDAGSTSAMYRLGLAYHYGTSAVRNLPSAREWYLKAAAGDEADGMYALGLMSYQGDGAAQSYSDAIAWYRRASDKGHVQDMTNLGRMYDLGQGIATDPGKAMQLFLQAAERNHPTAINNVGEMIYAGRGVQRDLATARGWLEKAAALGYSPTMFKLGVMNENGEGGPKNLARAVEWYRKAADLDLPEAIKKLQ
jgi:TPR repeat protein